MSADLPLLLTPGPLTTHPETRAAMAVDRGSRDPAFQALDAETWDRIAGLVRAEDPAGDWVCVPVQGSGSFAVEATLGTLVPPAGGCLVAVNGAYGRRMAQMLQRMGRRVVAVEVAEDQPVDPLAVDAALVADPGLTHVAVVHCETTTGIENPIGAVAEVVSARGRRLVVDAMSAFGALPLGSALAATDAVVASANKCLEGVPGVAFAVVRQAALERAAGQAPSLVLDLHDQWARRRQDGQWRFTPPTHVILALHRALELHAQEGGVAGRGTRYTHNLRVLVEGMRALGFVPLLPPDRQAPIIVTFEQPEHPAWDFPAVYRALVARGFAIYPGKLTSRPSFRVGCIGQVYPDDLHRFVEAMDEIMDALGLPTGAAPEALRQRRLACLARLQAAGDRYGGEAVTQLQHALQCAELARRESAPPELVAAALLHDLGHVVTPASETATRAGHDLRHETVGAAWLEWCGLPSDVTEPVRLHVEAKRFLARDPAYRAALSAESTRSLALQGGPHDDEQAAAFRARTHAQAAIRLRRWDDLAKRVDWTVPDLDSHRDLLLSL